MRTDAFPPRRGGEPAPSPGVSAASRAGFGVVVIVDPPTLARGESGSLNVTGGDELP